ncbi:hypothetical protein P7K49_030322 [Saguinus oedipus]|uniref:Uncharacterized protein n=1 Tax=Saguinus oedipus TaxID=9490 RepID=A0ABQ9U1V2_SAGOE|nr:hypothetical protein P7K49_030322 [Saguinus oedipus]
MARSGHTVHLGLDSSAQVGAACEDPPGPSSQLRYPRLHPTACPKAATLAGQDERRRSASSPPKALPAPNTGSLFRKAWRGGGKVSTCQPWQGRTRSLLRPAGQTEGSRVRWGLKPSAVMAGPGRQVSPNHDQRRSAHLVQRWMAHISGGYGLSDPAIAQLQSVSPQP